MAILGSRAARLLIGAISGALAAGAKIRIGDLAGCDAKLGVPPVQSSFVLARNDGRLHLFRPRTCALPPKGSGKRARGAVEAAAAGVVAGRVIVLSFWATWCGPCKEEATAFARAARRSEKTIVTFVGLDVRDAESDARSWVRRYHISYPVAHDNSENATQLYGVSALPATFIISPQGRVIDHITGFVAEKELYAHVARAVRLAR